MFRALSPFAAARRISGGGSRSPGSSPPLRRDAPTRPRQSGRSPDPRSVGCQLRDRREAHQDRQKIIDSMHGMCSMMTMNCRGLKTSFATGIQTTQAHSTQQMLIVAYGRYRLNVLRSAITIMLLGQPRMAGK
jgi:hypothetical protein